MAALAVRNVRTPRLPTAPTIIAAKRQAEGADHGDSPFILDEQIEERFVRALADHAFSVSELAWVSVLIGACSFEQQLGG
ncbi:hypothetical protein D3C86_1798440 [compost metagenome]